MSEIIKSDSFCPVITANQALMINNANTYLEKIQSEADQIIIKAKQQAKDLEEVAKTNSAILMETKSIELHKHVSTQLDKLLERLTNGIGEIITAICHKQKLEIAHKECLKKLISHDLRQYLDLDHVELTANSLATVELQNLLQQLFPQRNFIFKINDDLADYECCIETIFSVIHIDFKTSNEQLFSVLNSCPE